MKYEIGDTVRIVKDTTRPDHFNRHWVGKIGKIVDIERNSFKVLLHVESTDIELARLFGYRPVVMSYGWRQIEPYFLDINLLD